MLNKRITTRTITIIALCIGLNYIGGTIALWLRLPIYLDSIGTIFAGALLGPVFGVLTGITSGVLSGFTTDIFSLYYSPVQMITGLLAGIIFYQRLYQKKNRFTLIFWAFVLSLPGTILSSLITVKLFGGLTSSGSSMIVQLLHGLGMDLTMSTILVQAGTDYLDRLLSLILVAFVVVALGKRGRIGSQLKENQQ
ncbi:ECF transporter S component [Enterococcus durans]|uniref:ECF transporter S component n=1 Tax=Enterococcus durans TaxID=53345 RepID=UPI0039A5D776